MSKPLSEMTDRELRKYILEIEGAYARCRDWWGSNTLEALWNKAYAEQTRRIVEKGSTNV